MNLAGDLLFMGTVLGTLVALAALLYALIRRRWVLAKLLLRRTAAGAVLYFVLLLGVSLASRECVLPMHTAKPFCAADCDLTLRVLNAERAGGSYVVVTASAQSSAARVTMTPDTVDAILVDDRGREYPARESGYFQQPLGPGESATEKLTFGVPPDARDLKLLIREGGWMTHLVLGDENSFLHKKTFVKIDLTGQ